MAAIKKIPTVFDYLDYRRFLEDCFSALRMTDANFSMRTFAAKAGLPLSNSSFFSKVVAGKRNLTHDLQFKIAMALKLKAGDLQYFELLVRFNQSKDPDSKSHLYDELAKYSRSKARIITKEGNEYYSHWQYSIVRAFFGINQKENNPAAIAKKVYPQISPKDVDEGIKLLLQLGLIHKTANGFALRDTNIATERENKDFVGKLRIVEMLRLAQEVFNHIPAQNRDFSAMTVYISKDGFQAIRDKIRVFREELKCIVAADQSEDRIYTLGMQFFPNTVLPEWDATVLPPRT
jgi:uncharacterized protein (TIGR02147 family)